MSSSADVIARHTQKYHFSESELKAFLGQPTPREIPDPLKHRRQNSSLTLLAILCGIGGPVCIGLILVPQLFPVQLGQWATFLTCAGLLAGVVLVAGAIFAVTKAPRSLQLLLKNGELVTGRFSEIESPRPENLRSAASHTSVSALDSSGTVKLEFEVDGQTIRAKQILHWQYLQLATWYQQADRDVVILYSKDDPAYARWVGELLFPCPKPPSPKITLG